MRKIWILIIPVVFIIFFLTQSGGSSEEYVKEIDQYWEDKHNFYRTSQASPFVEKGVAYKEVQYFDPNPDYKIIGELERLSKRETLVLGNSDGTTTTYLKFANIHFKFKGQKHSLLLLKALGFGNQYLLAFGDGTSGVLTYGGGKYLDVSVGKSDQIELDFNKSYNPYCAYFDDFTCPLPPIENLLDIRIEAGEKYVE